MASVKESFTKLYMGPDIVSFHILMLTLCTIAMYVFFAYGVTSPISIISYIIFILIASGVSLQIMHDRLNFNDEKLPEIDENTFKVLIKVIPLSLILIAINFITAIIPIIGSLIQAVISMTVQPIMLSRFCKNYNTKEAMNFDKIKELSKSFLLPVFFLGIKITLISLVLILPIFYLYYIFARDNIFLILTVIGYIITIVNFVYMDNIAQIYNDLDFDNAEMV